MKHRPGRSPESIAKPAHANPQVPPARPLKPQPVLFGVIALVLVMWIAALLVMYFRTVRPAKNSPERTLASPPPASAPR